MLAYFPTTYEDSIRLQRGRRLSNVLPGKDEHTGLIRLYLDENLALSKALELRQAMAQVSAEQRCRRAKEQVEKYQVRDPHIADIWAQDTEFEIRAEDKPEMFLLIVDLDELELMLIRDRVMEHPWSEARWIQVTPDDYKRLTRNRRLYASMVEGTENLAALNNRGLGCV